MANNTNTSWERIQQGVSDTERLIGQKEYNASMIKARQTLEFMVKLLSERSRRRFQCIQCQPGISYAFSGSLCFYRQ